MKYEKHHIEKAKKLAQEYHKNQKYDNKPYMFHIESVVNRVKSITDSYEAIILAYLHDIVEDTEFSLNDVDVNFGQKMKRLVNFLTDEDGYNRKERKRKTNIKLSTINETDVSALIVKISDRLENFKYSKISGNKSKYKMYDKENKEFIKAVNRSYINKDIINELKSFSIKKNKVSL
tara:strand:- start:33345 stop:33875 length:531 start_codon:yes stop_codon:yes gene_type:complete